MKAEFMGGQVKWTIESTDGNVSASDFVTVVKNCSMSAEGFEELFYSYVPTSPTYTHAYERAETVHETLLSRRKYSDYDSFRKSKDTRNKR
jgi:hypothetical protein